MTVGVNVFIDLVAIVVPRATAVAPPRASPNARVLQGLDTPLCIWNCGV
jgi:hypothetical protein